MDQTVTVKAKLLNIDEETAHSFMQTMVKYKDACNFISQYVFNHTFELKQSKLNKALYRDLRNKFGLKAKWRSLLLKLLLLAIRLLKHS